MRVSLHADRFWTSTDPHVLDAVGDAGEAWAEWWTRVGDFQR